MQNCSGQPSHTLWVQSRIGGTWTYIANTRISRRHSERINSLFCTTHSDIVTKISRKFNLFLIFRDLLFARTCYYNICRTDHLRDVGEVSCSYTPRTPLSYFLQLLRYCLPPMISCKKRKPAPLAGFFLFLRKMILAKFWENFFGQSQKPRKYLYLYPFGIHWQVCLFV